MSRRKNGVKKDRVAKLDAINAIDKKVKRKITTMTAEELDKLVSRRRILTAQLKTSK
jgi:hypothetical protein